MGLESEHKDEDAEEISPLDPAIIREREAIYAPAVRAATERWGQSTAKAGMRFSGVKKLRL